VSALKAVRSLFMRGQEGNFLRYSIQLCTFEKTPIKGQIDEHNSYINDQALSGVVSEKKNIHKGNSNNHYSCEDQTMRNFSHALGLSGSERNSTSNRITRILFYL
jgi:hypothetical protein